MSLLRPLGDQWALNHAEGMLGGLAQAQHRYADAIAHLEQAAGATHRLGFAAAEAHHLANLGRAQEQSGERVAAVVTLERSIETAHSTGDLRTAALASARLARVLRVTGDRQAARERAGWARGWYAAAGGGEGLVLAEYVLAVVDADDGEPQAGDRLSTVLAAARDAPDPEVELLTRDALARLYAERGATSDAAAALDAADACLPAAGHLVSDGDRVDAGIARALLSRPS